MSLTGRLRAFLSSNRRPDADRSSLQSPRPPTYVSNVTAIPAYADAQSNVDTVRAWSASVPSASVVSNPESKTLLDEAESLFADRFSFEETKSAAATSTGPRYIYYRVYAEDGALPSNTSAPPDNPFLGRIKATSVPPHHTVKSLKRSFAKVEKIKDRTRTSLFLTPYSQSPMNDTGKVTILNLTGVGSIPQEPLALVVKLRDSERTALESEGNTELARTLDDSTISPNTRYRVHRSGRTITWVAPPHTPISIKLCISKVERDPTLASANLFADISCDTPLTKGHISILHADGPGLSPNRPMAIVHANTALEELIPVSNPSIPEGMYAIKHLSENIFWNASSPIYFTALTKKDAIRKKIQWYITHDTKGNIFMTSPYSKPSYWVGAGMAWSKVAVPWRLIQESPGSKFYYLSTDVNRNSQNLQVSTLRKTWPHAGGPGLMSPLHKGDQSQMWEFIPVT